MMMGALMSAPAAARYPGLVKSSSMSRQILKTSPSPHPSPPPPGGRETCSSPSPWWGRAGVGGTSSRPRRLGRCLESRHAVVQELRQHRVEVLAGVDEHVVDALAGTAAAHLDQVFFQGLDVAVAQGARVAQEVVQ